MGAALKFRNAEIPRQVAETARLKILHGPDTGAIFVLNGIRATVGRGDENDVVLTDLKASRRHAEFAMQDQKWLVRDLGSVNGITVNGKPSRGSPIKTGDTVTLGETTLEFVGAEAGTMLLRAVPRSFGEVEADRAQFRAQQEKVRQLAQFGGARPGLSAAAPSSGQNSRLPLLIGAVGIIAFVIFGSNDTHAPVKARRAQQKSLASYLPQSDTPLTKSAEVFFKEGFREYRERNYLRARTEFETALQISPGNSLATLYLENCNQAITDEVKFDLDQGKDAYESGNLKGAKLHYESVMRLLYRDQTNPSFIEARDQLAQVTKEMAEDSP